jgi:hypothetical protein
MPKLTPILLGTAGVAGLGYLFKDDIKQHVGYGSYLVPHKYYVYKASREMGLPLGQSLQHDLSKFSPQEWMGYSSWFNGPKGMHGTKDRETFLKWRESVKEHKLHNPHHWRALKQHPDVVPLNVKLESIADWYGVQRARGNTSADFKYWFNARKDRFPIDKPTVEEAERRLKTAEYRAETIYAQYMSRDDNGKRKYTWIAHDSEKAFKKAKRHVLENGYAEEGPVHKMTKAEFIKMANKENKYTSLEYTIASQDPMVRALTRRMAPEAQKKVWKRYAQIVLRNRNYGRKGQVAGEYVKTKDVDHD